MAGQQASKKSKKPRTPRNLNKPKMNGQPIVVKKLNRRGGGRPQPRKITAEAKITALQGRLLARELEFLGISANDQDPDTLWTVEVLTALNGQIDHHLVDQPGYTPVRHVLEAFYFAVSLNEDAYHAYISMDGQLMLAVPGIRMQFFRRFRPDKDLVNAIADWRHKDFGSRAKQIEPGYAALGVGNTTMARALVDAGKAPEPVAPKKAPTAEAKANAAKVAEATVA